MVLYNRTRVSRVPNRIVIGMETISASELKSGWSRLRIDDKRIIWRHEQSDYSILLFISKWTIFTFLLRNMIWYNIYLRMNLSWFKVWLLHTSDWLIWAGPQMPTTRNIERQMVSVGDPISQKNATSGFTWKKISNKTK